MKMLFLLLTLILSINLHSDDKTFVEIYQTHDNGKFGRSEDRDIVLSIKESVFKRHRTLQANPELDLLTAVVLDSRVAKKLASLFVSENSVHFGYIKITKDGEVYTIEDDSIFLTFSFSLEKVNKQLLSVISTHYAKLPMVRDIVLEHYNENYVIRIHSAENLLKPEAREITYDEALVMATIIGDCDQWLWGIHDGRGYLEDLLLD